MTIDLTNADDLDWMARGRIRLRRQIERGEIDLDDSDEEHEWIAPEYVAELRETYSDYLNENRDADGNEEDPSTVTAPPTKVGGFLFPRRGLHRRSKEQST